jgi:ATP-dependent Lon protease
MRNDLKDLLDTIPGFDPDRVLSPAMRALLALLAHDESRPPEAWLTGHIREILCRELSARYPNALSEGRRPRGFWAPTEAAVHDDDQESEPCEWTTEDLERCVDRLAEPVREALNALRTFSPRTDLHQLWTGQVEVTKGYRDDGKREWEMRLARQGPFREFFRPTPPHLKKLAHLEQDAPNLAAVTDHLVNQLKLAQRSRLGLRSAPRVLLVGPPAAGKTWWAEQVAAALGLPCQLISLANVTASFEISGGSTQWATARPGRIVRAFLGHSTASPVIVLDEIDKALTRNGYPTADALLDLIERSSATRWHDEFYSRNFDVSTAILIATANDPEKIDAPLRSRFHAFNVAAPRPDQMIAMVRSVWRHYRQMRHDLSLPATLDENVVEHIATRTDDARSVMRELDRALARSVERGGRIRIGVDDLRQRQPEPVYLQGPDEGSARH